jgi:hypothetical protein
VGIVRDREERRREGIERIREGEDCENSNKKRGDSHGGNRKKKRGKKALCA